MKPDLSQIFEPNTELLNFFSSSQYLMVFSSLLRPELLSLYSKLGRMRSDVTLIFTESFLEKILHDYEKKIMKFATMENTELFFCNDSTKLAELILSDRGMMLSLFDRSGRFYHDYIYCSRSEAINWAMELFEFYKAGASEIDSETLIKNSICTSENSALLKPEFLSLH